jgi:hypothetical protein
MMNCNPETVSTDYDTSSRLYFEPITVEDVLNVIEVERPEGIIVQVRDCCVVCVLGGGERMSVERRKRGRQSQRGEDARRNHSAGETLEHWYSVGGGGR